MPKNGWPKVGILTDVYCSKLFGINRPIGLLRPVLVFGGLLKRSPLYHDL